MNDLIQDPMFFYAVAFFIFLALAFKFGRKPALQWIDGEIAKIRNELDQARLLRAEAEAALAECKTKQAAAEAEAIAIVEHAKMQVAVLRQQAEADLAVSLERHKVLAAERIRMAEVEAVADVRAAAINLAMKIVRKTLKSDLPASEASKLVDKALAEIPALKPSKAEAA